MKNKDTNTLIDNLNVNHDDLNKHGAFYQVNCFSISNFQICHYDL